MPTVYQLTCPSCADSQQSPFIRHGAVVCCASCEQRYRIKSSYVTRTVTTGPKTLDEMDPLLRGDGVDLDTDAGAAPVKIDDDGNVVGLSGLSELMRQSDAAHAQAAAIARTHRDEDAPPPAARVTRPSEPGRRKPSPRARAGRNKKRSPLPLLLAGALLILFAGTIGGLAYVISQSGPTDPAAVNPPDADPTPRNPGGNGNGELFPDVPGDNPDGPDGGSPTQPGDDPSWLTEGGRFEDNPDYAYDPNAPRGDPPRPIDVPTVLTPGQPMEHEGWYILAPPRGSVDATGGGDIEMGTLEPLSVDGTLVVLAGVLTHLGTEPVVSGETHVALIDSAGRVFAETYLPFAGLRPGETQSVRLPIAQRFWERARDVRTRTVVLESDPDLKLLEGVQLQPAGRGAWSSVRVTVRNPNERWLRNALVLLWAEDVDGHTVARYRAAQPGIFVDPKGWLDIVVHVPINEADGPVSWHAQVIPQ